MKKMYCCLLALILTVFVTAGPAFAADDGTAAEGSCGEGLSWNFTDGTLTITGSGPMDEFEEDAPWAFHRDEIVTVLLQGGVTTVGANAFTGCKKLTQVDFGNALTEIGSNAFQGCDSLTSVSLPESFKIFGENSFRSCPGLKEIHCAGRFPKFLMNCLWDTHATIYFPAERPWSTEYIAQLEDAFHGRVEFLASDGTDPYTKPEPTESETTLPSETKPATEPESTPSAPPSETTRPAPPAETSAPPVTQTTTEPTIQPSTQPTGEPRPSEDAAAGWLSLILAAFLLAAAGTAVAIARGFSKQNRKGGKYRR